jgi:hypothetical protein
MGTIVMVEAGWQAPRLADSQIEFHWMKVPARGDRTAQRGRKVGNWPANLPAAGRLAESVLCARQDGLAGNGPDSTCDAMSKGEQPGELLCWPGSLLVAEDLLPSRRRSPLQAAGGSRHPGAQTALPDRPYIIGMVGWHLRPGARVQTRCAASGYRRQWVRMSPGSLGVGWKKSRSAGYPSLLSSNSLTQRHILWHSPAHPC